VTADLVKLFLEVTTLKRVPRAGWLLRGVPQVESVAEHSYSMAVTALSLADVLNASGTLAQPLDTGRVLTIALLHDLAEARLTDLPGPARKLIPADVKRRAEHEALAQMLRGLPSADALLALWSEFEDESTPEGQLVRDADKLEMMVQCLRYEIGGSRGLEEFWASIDALTWRYPLCAELYAELKARHARLHASARS
jgi:putative hydrolase of HD superfamily